jgi:hypothetical protein
MMTRHWGGARNFTDRFGADPFASKENRNNIVSSDT